jgi:hypothetical protein
VFIPPFFPAKQHHDFTICSADFFKLERHMLAVDQLAGILSSLGWGARSAFRIVVKTKEEHVIARGTLEHLFRFSPHCHRTDNA